MNKNRELDSNQKQCHSCGEINPKNNKFCGFCGSTLELRCSSCQAIIADGFKFCGECGTPVGESATPKEQDTPSVPDSLKDIFPKSLAEKMNRAANEILGERREVTVLFFDVAGFTNVSSRLDSEDVFLFIDEAMKKMVEVVFRYEGTVDKFTGDGLMALFGAPISHENDPERAVRAAMEMLTIMQPLQAEIQARHAFDFSVRIGINTGTVIAGNLGSDLHMEYTVIGDTVNLASRLESAAKPNTALVSFSTYQRTRPIFEYDTIRDIKIKGLEEPITGYRPTSVMRRPGRVRGIAGLKARMIGRSEALTDLQNIFETVQRESKALFALVTGEAGLGKSRLVEEFVHQNVSHIQNIFQGACLSYAKTRPYWVISEVLRDMLKIVSTDSVEYQFNAIESYFSVIGLSGRQEIEPYLYYVLDLPQRNTQIDDQLKLLEPAIFQQQLHGALRYFFLQVVGTNPSVIVLDDLHWVDSATIEFLKFLSLSLDNEPVFVLMVSRAAERKTVIKDLLEQLLKIEQRFKDIPLAPLTETHTKMLIDSLVRDESPGGYRVKQTIVERVQGNPFYAEELVRILIDQGGLVEQDGDWIVTPDVDEMLKLVPGTLKDLILARVDALPVNLRQLLQKASVVGWKFSTGMLGKLGTDTNNEGVKPLETLENQNFINKIIRSDQSEYVFTHPLLQDTIYSTLLKRDRRKLHGEIAELIVNDPALISVDQDEMLARHYSNSTTPEKALPYLIRIGEDALQRYALSAAMENFEKALAIIIRQKKSDLHLELIARIGLGQAFKFQGDFQKSSNMIETGLQKLLTEKDLLDNNLEYFIHGIREIADIRIREGAFHLAIAQIKFGIDKLGKNPQEEHPKLWRGLMDRLAWIYFRKGDLAEAEKSATGLLSPAFVQEDELSTTASIYNTLGGINYARGEFFEAISYVEKSLAINKKMGSSYGVAIGSTNLGVLHNAVGDWGKSIEKLQEADAIHTEQGFVSSRPTNLKNLGEVLIQVGHYEDAEKSLLTSLDLSTRLGMRPNVTYALLGLARLKNLTTKPAEALTYLQKTENYIDQNSMDMMIQANYLRGWAEGLMGNVSEALGFAYRAIEMAKSAEMPNETINAYYVLGILYGLTGDLDSSKQHFVTAINLADETNSNYWKARCQLGLARELYKTRLHSVGKENQQKADLSEMQKLIQESSQIFRELGAEADLEQAEAMLRILKSKARTTGDLSKAAIDFRFEKRPITILWFSLEPGESADEEDFFEQLYFLIPSIIDSLRNAGGTITRRKTGFTLTFGLPYANADDPRRAMQTAIQIVEYIVDFSQQYPDLNVRSRVALHTGSTIFDAGASVEDSQLQFSGHPMVIAKNLSQVVPDQKIWLTSATMSALGDEFSLISQKVDNLPEHDTVYEWAGWGNDYAMKIATPWNDELPFVGRERELSTIIKFYETTASGHGKIVWVEGDEGIGKSRLLREANKQIRALNGIVWYERCTARNQSDTFSLFSNLLGRAFDLDKAESHAVNITKVMAKFEEWAIEFTPISSYAGELVNVIRDDPDPIYLDPEQYRLQIFIALKSVLNQIALHRPLTIFIDDMHWIDDMSEDAFRFVKSLVLDTSIMFVCSVNPSQIPPNSVWRDDLMKERPDAVKVMKIKALATTAIEEIMHSVSHDDEFDPPVEQIIHKSGGNPLFLESILRMREKSTSLDDDIPISLQGLLQARLDRIPAPLIPILKIASVIGGTFPEHVLSAIMDRQELSLPLTQLEKQGVIERTGTQAEWRFTHPLIEELIYSSILKSQAKDIHLQIASILEDTRQRQNQYIPVQDLAFHYERAGETQKAIEYTLLTAEQAMGRFSNKDAIRYFEIAESIANTTPDLALDTRWRIVIGCATASFRVGDLEVAQSILEKGFGKAEIDEFSDWQMAKMSRIFGEIAMKLGNYEIAVGHFGVGKNQLLKPSTHQEYAELALLELNQSWVQNYRGNYLEAIDIANKALEWAKKSEQANILASCHNLLGGAHYRLGNISKAIEHTDRAGSIWNEIGYEWGLATNLNNLGILAFTSGQWQKSRQYYIRSLRIRRKFGDNEGVVASLNNLGIVLREQGNLKEAERAFVSGITIATRHTHMFNLTNAILGLAEVMLKKGAHKKARELIARAFGHAQELGAKDLVAEVYILDAEVNLETQAYHTAIDVGKQALEHFESLGNMLMVGRSHRLLAAAYLATEDEEQMQIHLETAWGNMQDALDELEQGRLHALSAKVHRSKNQPDEVARHQEAAKRIFKKLGAKNDLKYLL